MTCDLCQEPSESVVNVAAYDPNGPAGGNLWVCPDCLVHVPFPIPYQGSQQGAVKNIKTTTFHQIKLGPEWKNLVPGDIVPLIKLQIGEYMTMPAEIYPSDDGSLLVSMVTMEDKSRNIETEVYFTLDDDDYIVRPIETKISE